ncbi:hypothetical protein EHS25_007979 [Saitozyma podzolica]|uniref:Uncharacterized protein n=1 Tax=Saitozyma podzolica TaxID=1890683 RepID=A0A427XL34_9TREE|nr:hypothetical protein EHS25_007979 [Saitozyma podzolica]
MSFLPSFRSLPLTTRLPLAGSSVNTPLAAAGLGVIPRRPGVGFGPGLIVLCKEADAHDGGIARSSLPWSPSSSVHHHLPLPVPSPHPSLPRQILEESSARIAELEGELDRVKRQQRRAIERERKQRERILPIVVEKVLQKVGAMQGSEHEEDEEDVKHAPLLV